MSFGMISTQLKMARPAFSFILILFVSTHLVIVTKAQQSEQTQVAYTSPTGVKYFLYLPKGYDTNTSATFPMLVYLHGGGDITDSYDLNAILTSPHTAPPWLINQNKWPKDTRPFIVLTPLLKKDPAIPSVNDQQWSMQVVDDMVELIKTNYRVNPNKIYFTGMSLGAAGCWQYAATHPEKVAGLLAFAGNTNISTACTLADIPVWAFHGTEDGLVAPKKTMDMVDAINACAGGRYDAHLNLLFSRNHEGWNEVYDGSMGYNVFDWLLQFSKDDLSNKAPFVYAGNDLKIMIRSGSFYLAGEYFDSDGTISTVKWTQTSGTPVTLTNDDQKLLKISNLSAGNFEFELAVTDNSGHTNSDRVNVQVLSTLTGPAVTTLTLYNATANQSLGNLYDGMVFNKNGFSASTRFNITATASGGANSVMFGVNSDQKTRTSSSPFAIVNQYNLMAIPIGGDYNVCATGYPGPDYGPGVPGITQCFKISIYDQPVKNFYPKPSTDIGAISSWGTNTDGTGTAPASFSDNFQNFNIDKTVTLNTPIPQLGVQSNFYVKNGGQLTINAALNATVNTEGNAMVTINTPGAISLGTLSASSTINFDQNATLIPHVNYGNIMFSGAGSTKTLASDTTIVSGNITIADNVTLKGNVDETSLLSLGGNLTINEDAEFNPSTRFGLQLTGTNQLLTVSGTKAAFSQLSVGAGGAELATSATPTTLEVGSSSGGGLFIGNGGNLNIHNHNLIVSQSGSFNSGGETGTLAVTDGTVSFNSSTSLNSNLYLAPTSNAIQALTVDLNGGGELNVQNTANISDFIKSKNGTIHANGNLSLVSTQNKTARIEPIEGSGTIEGSVEFQRYIDGKDLYKYISFPVSSATVSDFQVFIPVSGNFEGASSRGAASLYYYDEQHGGWTRFPRASNAEAFLPGKGYAVSMRQGTPQTTVKMKGPIQQGDFTFELSGDPNTSNSADGWNLIGNPYPSPIQWGGAGWSAQGVNATIYVRDNAHNGGSRFLAWDGVIGDAEFLGQIAQGQSIWVRVTSASPQLTIQESAKISAGNTALWREKQEAPIVDHLIIELKKDNLIDRTFLKLNPLATDRFDTQLDGVKQKNDYFNLSSLSKDSVSLVINNLSDSSCVNRVNLQVSTKDPGSYTFSFQGNLLEKNIRQLYLVDKYLNTKTLLKQGAVYNFTVSPDAKTSGKRFQIEMNATADPIITADGTTLKSNFQKGNQWLVNGQPIKGATGQVYEPVQSGQYQVRVAEGNCGIMSDNFVVSITGVAANQPTSQAVELYPNPARNIFHLRGQSAGGEDIRYSILNLYGVSIAQGTLSASDFAEGGDISLPENAQSGIYFLRLENQHLNYTAKLVVE